MDHKHAPRGNRRATGHGPGVKQAPHGVQAENAHEAGGHVPASRRRPLGKDDREHR
jgi:hypothetical protein